MTRYRTVEVNGLDVFVREAGDPANPTLLLLHGFPSSSFMFRELMPLLAPDLHVIAPDYPGFGNTQTPPPAEFAYTFDNLATTIEGLLDALDIERFGIYIQDYGAPVGMRLARSPTAARSSSICSTTIATTRRKYPAFHQLLRRCRPPTLIAWGERDPYFTVDGARAFLRDQPDAELHLLPTGYRRHVGQQRRAAA